MIDIKLLRESPEQVRESQKKRGMNSEIVDEFLEIDKTWRELKLEVDNLRAKRNKLSESINQAKKEGKDVKTIIEEAKKIPEKLQRLEEEIKEKEIRREDIWKDIQNITDKSVPVGGAEKNKVIKEYGKPEKAKFEHKDHADILMALNLLDTQKASDVAASRFYYLKGELVKLNFAIINYALDLLRKK
jgi:seryl-tRNA synthetase